METFLPMQLIYAGKTDRCHPNGIFNITHTLNHWSCEKSAIEYLEKVVFPYLSKKREQLKMQKNKKALLIFDVFKGQTTQQVKDVILANNCVYVFVPKNLTNHFQPLDLNVNGQAKQFLKRKFESWYADQVTKEIEKGTNVYSMNIKTKLLVVKPLHAR